VAIRQKHCSARGYGIFYGKTSNSTYYALRVEMAYFSKQLAGAPDRKHTSTASLRAHVSQCLLHSPGPAVAPIYGRRLHRKLLFPQEACLRIRLQRMEWYRIS